MEIREVYNRILGQGLILTILITDGLLFKSTGNTTVTLDNLGNSYTNGTISYSKNSTPWTSYTFGDAISLSDKETVVFKGTGHAEQSRSSTKNIKFTTTGAGTLIVSGNLSALAGDGTLLSETVGFTKLFSACLRLTDASLLNLNYTLLGRSCYYAMFSNCTNLTSLPSLNATTLNYLCYSNMFYGCSKITGIPSNYLSAATTLAPYCYASMFNKCTSLSSIPLNLLPATTLASGCYNAMFTNCQKLSSVPTNLLTAATITAPRCYHYMFQDCRALSNAPLLPATELALSCYAQMFKNCWKLSTITNQLTAAESVTSGCCYEMFANCSSLLSVNINNFSKVKYLEENCYNSMFNGCSALKSVGINFFLEVLETAPSCCSAMFKGCTALTAIPKFPAIQTTTEDCYNNMYNGCGSLVTAQILPATDLVQNCYKEMFSGCNSLTSLTSYFPNWYNSEILEPAPSSIPTARIKNYGDGVSAIPLTFISHGKNKIRLRRKEGPAYANGSTSVYHDPISAVVLQYSLNGGEWTTYQNTSGTNGLSSVTNRNVIPTGAFILLNNNDTLAFRNTTNYFGGGVLYFESLRTDTNGSLEVIGNINSLINGSNTVQQNPSGSHYLHNGISERLYDNFFWLFEGCKGLNARHLRLIEGTTYSGNGKPLSTFQTQSIDATVSTYLYVGMFGERVKYDNYVPSSKLPIFGTGDSADGELTNFYANITGYVNDTDYFSASNAKYTYNWTSGITTVGIYYRVDELDEIYNGAGDELLLYVPYTSSPYHYHLCRYYEDSSISAVRDNTLMKDSGASHFIPSAWHSEIILDTFEYNWSGICDSGERDIIPLFKSGIFHHNGKYHNEDITYVWDETNSQVHILDNDHYDGYVDPKNPSNNLPSHVTYAIAADGSWVTRNQGSEYFFFPMLSDPFSISATQAFKVALSSKVKTHKKWVIRRYDPNSTLSSCNGVPLSAGMTLKSKDRDTLVTTLSTFQSNWTHIPIYCSAVIQNRDIPITRTLTGKIVPGYIRWDNTQLHAGVNVFLVPANGLINFWNMTNKLNSPDSVDYHFVTCGSVNETYYGDLNSLRDHIIIPKTKSDLPLKPYRLSTLQRGAFKSLFQGNTNIKSLDVTKLPVYAPAAITVPPFYCQNMFSGCTGITGTINHFGDFLINEYSYANMFANCTNIRYVGDPYSTWNIWVSKGSDLSGSYSCLGMFSGCTGITGARIKFNAGTGIGSFKYMFKGCNNLDSTQMNITIECSDIQKLCYKGMFQDCTALEECPSFTPWDNQGANIALGAFESIFQGCTNLVGGTGLYSFFNSVLNNGVDIRLKGLASAFANDSWLTFPELTIGTIETATVTLEEFLGYPDYRGLSDEDNTSLTPVVSSYQFTLNSANAYTIPGNGWIRMSNVGIGVDSGSYSLLIDGVLYTFCKQMGNHVGNTFLIPIKAGSQVKYTGDSNPSGSVKYAPALPTSDYGKVGYPDYNAYQTSEYGSDHCVTYQNGTLINPGSDGWLRISVINITQNEGCLRFYEWSGTGSPTEGYNVQGWASIPLYSYQSGGNGTTFMLPISRNKTYKVYSSVSNLNTNNNNKLLIQFAPSRMGNISFPLYTQPVGYSNALNITRDVAFEAPVNGWIRLWVEDNNNLGDGCLRFTINGANYDTAVPLYQFKPSGAGFAYFLPVKAGDSITYYCSINYQTNNATSRVWFTPNIGAYTGITKKVIDDDVINNALQMSFRFTRADSFNSMFRGCNLLTYTPVLNITISTGGDYNGTNEGNEMFYNCKHIQYFFVGLNIRNGVRAILPNSTQTPKYMLVPSNWPNVNNMPVGWQVVEYSDYSED